MAKELVIQLPPEVEQYANDIRRFTDAMVHKLRVHHRKGRWENKSPADYVPLLQGEVDELLAALRERNTVEVLLEGADVANMAMIIASIMIDRGDNTDA